MFKDVLRCACALGLAASISACHSKPSPSPENKASVSITQTLPSSTDYVSKYYRELQAFELSSNGLLTTRMGTRFQWFNYTDYSFNPVSAASTFSYFQELVPGQGTNFSLVYKGREMPIRILPRLGNQERALFFVPGNAPKPSTWGLEGEFNAATHVEDGGRATATYIKLENIPPVLLPDLGKVDLTKAFAVEACHQFVTIGLLTSKDFNYPNLDEVARDAQEATCGSLGIAFALRQQGLPHEVYSRTKVTSSFFNSELIRLAQSDYNKIPLVESLFTHE